MTEDIEACEKAGIEPYVPRPQRGPSVKAGLFREDEFQYDEARNSYLPGWSASSPLFIVASAGVEEDQLRQQTGLRRLLDPLAMHGWQVSHGVAFGERSGVGWWGSID
jgi:hypothetical protein